MIELLPEGAEETAGLQLTTKLLIFGLFILLSGSSFYLHTTGLEYQQKSSQAAAKIKKLIRRKKDLAAKIEQRQRYRELATRANLADYARIVDDLQVVMPRQVWLKKFQINKQQVVFSGQAEEGKRVINVLQRIGKYPYFTRLELTRREQRKQGFSFRLVGRLADEG